MPTNDPRPGTTSPNLDTAEVARFSAIAAEWWDPKGKFRPLHQIGPPRLAFVRERICSHLALSQKDLRPFVGLKILDIGCGGGLISEPLARLGARVTGIDPAERNIEVARAHAAAQGIEIDYRAVTVETLAAAGETYDAVVCLEVVEHVPDVGAFLATCGKVVRPGGIMVLSTINRTLKSYALAIVGAEYVLRWLPVGTHQWDRFVTPAELDRHLDAADLRPAQPAGLVYNPLADQWSLDRDTDVNYLTSAVRNAV